MDTVNQGYRYGCPVGLVLEALRVFMIAARLASMEATEPTLLP